ncbi:carbon-nitrogen hydrolase family protein [Bacteroidota bacterium]
MSKILTIGTCQHPVYADVKRNLSLIRKQMRYASLQNADIVHFSECNLSGYAGIDFNQINRQEYSILQESVLDIRGLVANLGIWVILGSHHFEQGMKKPFNCLYLIDNKGEIVDRYDKRLLAGLHGDRDPEYYFPGKGPVVFRISGFKCGLLICHEWRYPELYREYFKMNVDIIFQSWYDGNLSREQYETMGRELGELIPGTVRGNAASNYLWVSVSNNSRKESSFPSMMVQPDGRVLHKLHRNRAGVLISRIDGKQVFVDPSSDNRSRIIKN